MDTLHVTASRDYDILIGRDLLKDAGALLAETELAFHPCDNTQTLAMGAQDFFDVFLPAVGHAPRFVEIHDFM